MELSFYIWPTDLISYTPLLAWNSKTLAWVPLVVAIMLPTIFSGLLLLIYSYLLSVNVLTNINVDWGQWLQFKMEMGMAAIEWLRQHWISTIEVIGWWTEVDWWQWLRKELDCQCLLRWIGSPLGENDSNDWVINWINFGGQLGWSIGDDIFESIVSEIESVRGNLFVIWVKQFGSAIAMIQSFE